VFQSNHILPFFFESASGTVLFEGSNSFTSTSMDASGLGCSQGSNVTIEGIGDGKLHTQGG
jgi:hypothetical protein